MKSLTFTLFLTISASVYAGEKCSISAKDLNFTTPKSEKIANTFWQEDQEAGEAVKRLFIAYIDGSSAVIKHRFCDTYKFEAAYYMEDQNRTVSTDDIKNKLTELLPYIAHKDDMQKKAVNSMLAELAEQQFDQGEILGAAYNGHESVYGDTSYSILYFPINYSSLHSAAIYMDVGIGGIH